MRYRRPHGRQRVHELPVFHSRRLDDVDAVVSRDLRSGYFAIQEIADQRRDLALIRIAEAAAAGRHDRQVLAALDPATEFARDFFSPALFFEIESTEAAIAAVVESTRRKGGAVPADID